MAGRAPHEKEGRAPARLVRVRLQKQRHGRLAVKESCKVQRSPASEKGRRERKKRGSGRIEWGMQTTEERGEGRGRGGGGKSKRSCVVQSCKGRTRYMSAMASKRKAAAAYAGYRGHSHLCHPGRPCRGSEGLIMCGSLEKSGAFGLKAQIVGP